MPRSASRLRAAVFPRPLADNPYQARLHQALEARGVELLVGEPLTPGWARSVSGVTAVHLHWVEYLVRSQRGGRLRGLFGLLRTGRLLLGLWILRRRGIAIVWTVHNLAPHESAFPRLERLALLLVARLSDRLLVHSAWAAEQVARTFGRRVRDRIRVAPHGNYIESYAEDARPREVVRAELGLPPEAFVYLLFGVLRPYKRVPEAIEAFATLDAQDARLVVAGGVDDPELKRRIEEAADADPRVRLRLGFVPDAAVGGLFRASDAAVLNYAEVFSSGALLLALSFGVPVVAPATGTATEVAPPPAVEPFEAEHLLDALKAIRHGDPVQRSSAARHAARRADWFELADAVVAAYLARQS